MTDIADNEDLQKLIVAAGTPSATDNLAEPEPDEEGDEIVFVRNGWIRVTIAGSLHKLRRPFLRELQDLEASMEAGTLDVRELQESLKAANNEDLATARRISDEAKAITDDDSPRKFELDEESTQLAIKVMERNRQIERRARELRALWWEQVFKTLTPPGHDAPKDAPSWAEDLMLPSKLVQHWRSAPLAHGS